MLKDDVETLKRERLHHWKLARMAVNPSMKAIHKVAYESLTLRLKELKEV